MAKRGQALPKARAVRGPAKSAVDLKQEIAALRRELAQEREQRAATGDALNATADVLKVISRSTFDLQTVLETLAESAVRLCSAERGLVFRFDGKLLRFTAGHNVSPAFRDFLGGNPITPGRNSNAGRAALERRTVHNLDVQSDPEYTYGGARVDPYRTVLAVPMHKGDELVGVFVIYRHEVHAFTDNQIALMETFADQAVIAIENVRLFEELQQRTRDLSESLEQQTATAEVLQVINSSPGDLEPVFTTMLEKATRLCGAGFGSLWLYDGEQFRAAAMHAVPPAFAEFCRRALQVAGSASLKELVGGSSVVHVPDLVASELYRAGNPIRRAVVDLGGGRSLLSIPLRKDNVLLGAFTIYRKEVKPFSDNEIALVQNFAAQAVIAMENARLITETREALERQTATAEILRVISSSPTDVKPTFDAIAAAAKTLSDGALSAVLTYDGKLIHWVAAFGWTPDELDKIRGVFPIPPDRGTTVGRAIMTRQVAHIADMSTDPEYAYPVLAQSGGHTVLAVPMLRDGVPIGAINVQRRRAELFSDKQIDLLKTFADQAVIAIENVRLFNELRDRQAELARSVDELTATGDVLKIISRSSVELGTVLDTVVETVARLCCADQAVMWRRQDDLYQVVAAHGLSQEAEAFVLAHPVVPGRGIVSGRAALERRPVQVSDVLQDPEYTYSEGQKLAGFRTVLSIPLLREDTLVGIVGIHRTRVEPFTDKEIELATTFADQAVIAIENARLFDEVQARVRDLTESLEQQQATSEILRVISSSPTNVQPVFDTIVRSAVTLCEGLIGAVAMFDGELMTVAAVHNYTPEALAAQRRLYPMRPSRQQLVGRAILSRTIAHVPDVLNDPEYAPDIALAGGWRAGIAVPLMRNELPIGAIVVMRAEAGPFSDGQTELLKTFADQAVIAIENVGLFKAVQARTEDLSESLRQQTATADVLKIISRSTFDLEIVLQTLVESAARLCDADKATITRQRDGVFYRAESYGFSREFMDYVKDIPVKPERGSVTGRTLLEGTVIHIADVQADPEFTFVEAQRLGDFHTILGVPMLREAVPIGVIALTRSAVRPFTDRQIDLVRTFADQAAIAIENARLITELRERTNELAQRQAELRVTFDNMGDGVVMFDAEARLTAWNRNFQEMLELPDTFLRGRPTFAEYFHYLAERGEYVSADLEEQLGRAIEDTRREMRFERTRPDGRVVEVRRNPVPGGGFVMIYSDITERKRAEEAIRTARDAAETALRELQTAQASLVHAQKMAALGQLTAGIAHEIKNPLNFVNNFAGLSVELLDELKQATVQAIGALDADKHAEIVETIGMLTGNLEKIAEHGRRADGIVRSMLQHSRGGSGERQASDLNALVEEALNLAYHGARAQDQSFNITMERDFDQNLAPIEVVPQDMMRVVLNLIGNGFYAASKRRRDADGAFRPVLKVTTREVGDAVEIRVRDNGIGIPPEHREKLFQPFFTTKPTGEGTGLGLSISFDIVTQQQGGTITVDSEVGQFTEFTVRLPRRRHSAAGRVA